MQPAPLSALSPVRSSLDICLVVSGPNEGGGIERHVRDLADGLARNHSVHVLAHRSLRSLFDSSVQFHPIEFTRWRFDIRFLIQCARQIRRIQPSVVHAHGRKAARVVSILRNFLASPCILTVHNLKSDSQLYKKFDCVIAVSKLVAQGIEHPKLFTIHNGC
ncbi:MAG: glycosyltransferase family 4 protein [Gammaproteobacteria bacterium]|nr:glycosyltransferase family 4 protein [Gammaproteobacteria bacterium]